MVNGAPCLDGKVRNLVSSMSIHCTGRCLALTCWAAVSPNTFIHNSTLSEKQVALTCHLPPALSLYSSTIPLTKLPWYEERSLWRSAQAPGPEGGTSLQLMSFMGLLWAVLSEALGRMLTSRRDELCPSWDHSPPHYIGLVSAGAPAAYLQNSETSQIYQSLLSLPLKNF